MRMTYHDWGLLVLLSLLWGGAFFFAAVAVRELPPLTVVLSRTGLAALVLACLLRYRNEDWPFRARAIPAFLIMGLLNNLLPFSLLFWANRVTTAAGEAARRPFRTLQILASQPTAVATGTVRSLSSGRTMRAPMAMRKYTTNTPDHPPSTRSEIKPHKQDHPQSVWQNYAEFL